MQEVKTFVQHANTGFGQFKYLPEIQLNKFLREHPNYRICAVSPYGTGGILVVFDITNDNT